MGLIKTIEAKAGFEISYWKITDWKINQNAKAVDIILTPYLSSQSRIMGYEPIRDEIRKIRVSDYYIQKDHPLNRFNYTDYFSPEALEKAAKEGKSIYNVMYEYVKIYAPEFNLAMDS